MTLWSSTIKQAGFSYFQPQIEANIVENGGCVRLFPTCVMTRLDLKEEPSSPSAKAVLVHVQAPQP